MSTATEQSPAAKTAPPRLGFPVPPPPPAQKAAGPRALAPKPPAPPKASANKAQPDDEGTGGDGHNAGQKKTRHQLTSVLEIDISQARVATHLKNNLGDEAIEAVIKRLRAELKTAKEANEAGKVAQLKTKINDESKNLIRLSSDAPIALAVASDTMVKDLIRHAMDQTIATDRHMVEVTHIHSGRVSDVPTWPLFRNLPTFAGFNAEHEEELKATRAAANKAAKDARDAKKPPAPAKGDATKKAPKAPGAKAADEIATHDKGAAPEDEDAEAHTGKTTFFTYVENALKTVKKEERYKSMRVSNRLREYCSDLVAELILRFSHLSRIMVKDVMGVRTLTADHVKSLVRLLMADEGRSEDAIEPILGLIDAKLSLYHGHVKTERQKKFDQMADEKKAEILRKKQDQEMLRKKKAAEAAEKRASDASQKAAELKQELAKAPAAVPRSDPSAAEPAAGAIANGH